MSVRDELANVLADSLNKQFKDMKVAYFLDGSDTTPTDIKEFVSTGSTMLDLAISNKPNGGIAVGRITEIYQERSYDELTQALNDYLNGGTEENGSETKSEDTTKKVTVEPSTYNSQKTSDAFDDLFNS